MRLIFAQFWAIFKNKKLHSIGFTPPPPTSHVQCVMTVHHEAGEAVKRQNYFAFLQWQVVLALNFLVPFTYYFSIMSKKAY